MGLRAAHGDGQTSWPRSLACFGRRAVWPVGHPAGTGIKVALPNAGAGRGSTMKQHKFWAFAAIACMVMCVITGKRHA